MTDRLILWRHGTGFEIVVDEVEQRFLITAIGAAVPPIVHHVVYKIKTTVHPYRWAAADIARPQVTHKSTVMSANSAAKSVVIGIETFGKYTVRHSDVHCRQFLWF